MKRSESISQLLAALIKFQAMVGKPRKNKEATIYSQKGTYSYKYADLESISDTIQEPLAKCGLGWTQDPVKNEQGETTGVKTIIFHESGEFIEFEPVIIPGASRAHDIGSALSYARRYSLCLALGIVAEDDDDANSIMQNETGTNQQPKRPQQQQKENQPKQDNQQTNIVPLNDKVTEKQRKMIFAIAKNKLTEEEVKSLIRFVTGKDSINDLTKKEANVIISLIQNHSREQLILPVTAQNKGLTFDQFATLMRSQTEKEKIRDLTDQEIVDLIRLIQETDLEELALIIDAFKTLDTYKKEAK